MANVTVSEIAGFGVGALLLIAASAAPRVDSFVARSQRRSLKLCEECGGVTKLPCLECKGRGQVTEGFFSALSSEPKRALLVSLARAEASSHVLLAVNNRAGSSEQTPL